MHYAHFFGEEGEVNPGKCPPLDQSDSVEGHYCEIINFDRKLTGENVPLSWKSGAS